MTTLPPSGPGALLCILAITLFCTVWVLVASRRRKIRLTVQRRNLERAVAQEIARNQQPERVSL